MRIQATKGGVIKVTRKGTYRGFKGLMSCRVVCEQDGKGVVDHFDLRWPVR